MPNKSHIRLEVRKVNYTTVNQIIFLILIFLAYTVSVKRSILLIIWFLLGPERTRGESMSYQMHNVRTDETLDIEIPQGLLFTE